MQKLMLKMKGFKNVEMFKVAEIEMSSAELSKQIKFLKKEYEKNMAER